MVFSWLKKEKLEKDVDLLKSSMEELTSKINQQLLLSFEIMRDAMMKIMLDFDFKRLDEITVVKATRLGQVTTPVTVRRGWKLLRRLLLLPMSLWWLSRVSKSLRVVSKVTLMPYTLLKGRPSCWRYDGASKGTWGNPS